MTAAVSAAGCSGDEELWVRAGAMEESTKRFQPFETSRETKGDDLKAVASENGAFLGDPKFETDDDGRFPRRSGMLHNPEEGSRAARAGKELTLPEAQGTGELPRRIS